MPFRACTAWIPAFAGMTVELPFNRHQMLHLADLAEDLGGLVHFHGAAHLVEAEAEAIAEAVTE